MVRQRVHTTVEQLQPCEWGRIIGQREVGWTYQQIAVHVGHNVGCRCFQQWSVEHSHIFRPGSGGPHSMDVCQDWRIVQAVVATQTESKEEIWAHVAPAVSPRTIRNHLPAAGLTSHMPLARLPLIPRHCQARLVWCHERVDWRVKWCTVVFNDESRFCLYASDGLIHVWHGPGEHHLLKYIRPWHTVPTSGFMVWGAISYNSWPHLVFLQGKLNSAYYIVQVNSVLLSFNQQECDVLFQQDSARPHRLLWRTVLFVV